MKVADIVREYDKRGSLHSLLLHGKVKGIVETPNEFTGLTLVRGNWAVLELYAVTCKDENYFGVSDTSYLTPRSTVLFVLSDSSLVGKLVTVKGERGRGVTLRKQKVDNQRIGFSVPIFSKSKDEWLIHPNEVEEYKKTTSKEINSLFEEFSKFEPYYLPITRSVQGFDGASEYKYLSTGSRGRTSLQYSTDFSSSINEGKLDELRVSLYSANALYSKFSSSEPSFKDNLYIVRDLLDRLDEGSGILDRLIPRTNKLVRSLIPKKPESYREFLSMVLGVELESGISDLVLLNAPHYYYLVGRLEFDVAEQIFYISNLVTGGVLLNCKYRGVALIAEGAIRTYRRLGHSVLLNSLVFPRACRLSDCMIDRFKETNSPLSKEAKGLLDLYYTGSSNDYINLVDINYYISDDDGSLVRAIDCGIVIEPKLKCYSLSRIVELEIDLADSLNELSTSLFDYDIEQLQPSIDYVKSKYSYEFEQSQLRSFINLNTGFGMFLGSSASGFYYIQEVLYLTAKSKGYFSKTLVVDVAYNKPSWIDDYDDVEFLPLDALCYKTSRAITLDEPTLVLVNNAHRLDLDEYVSLVDYLSTGSALYVFGSPWSGMGVFNTLATKFSRAVVLPNSPDLGARELSLSTINSGFSLSKGKNLKVSNVSVAESILTFSDMVRRSLDAGIDCNELRVVSDLEKTMSYENLGNHLLKVFTSGLDLDDNMGSVLVAAIGVTYELFSGKDSLGSHFGSLLGTVIRYDSEYAELSLWNSGYVARVKRDELVSGYCLPSELAELYPVSVSFVSTQRNKGNLTREMVVRSLNSTKGVSFIGSESAIVSSHSEYSKLPVTLMGVKM